MKVSFDSASSTYNTETCDSFSISLPADSISLFITSSYPWNDVGSPSNNILITSSSNLPTLSSVTTKTLNDLGTIATAMNYNSCSTSSVQPAIVTIVPSTAANQNYDLSSVGVSKFYTVPGFSLNPSTSTGVISYTDAAPVSGVTFHPSTRTFDWSALANTGTYTLSMQGSLAGSTSVKISFTLTII